MTKKVFLTGDRPTGKLHIGHYVGSLRNRVALQDSGDYDSYIMIADNQALTDNAHDPEKIRKSLLQVAMDYLAVGIDPQKSTILVQSQIPALTDMMNQYLNLVTVARLNRNPTVKTEIKQKALVRVFLPVSLFIQSVRLLILRLSRRRPFPLVTIKNQCSNRPVKSYGASIRLTKLTRWSNLKATSHQRAWAEFLDLTAMPK